MLNEQTVQRLLAFRHARDWEQFHSPKNLAIALSVEAGELLEHFQWTTDQDRPKPEGSGIDRVALELADITMLIVYMAHDLGVDIDASVRTKLSINELRYPAEKCRGRSNKYDQLE